MQAQSINLSKLVNNSGQIEGLPANPRLIKDDKYKKLVQSIKDDPEMLDLRELLVYPSGNEYVVIAGNMRLKALTELGYKDAPCKILAEDTSVEKLKAYTIKDNIGYGEHDYDILANEWDAEQLEGWGLDLPGFENDDIKEQAEEPEELELKPYKRTHVLISFPPEKMILLQSILQQLTSFEFIEYEQSSN